MTERRSIIVGGETIEYDLTRKKMKKLRIKVALNGEVSLSCPVRTPLNEIERFVEGNAEWIMSARSRVLASVDLPKSREYLTGEKFLFLGEELTLLVEQGASNSLTRQGEYLFMKVRDVWDKEKKKRLLDKWYSARASEIFAQRFERLVNSYRDLFCDNYSLKIRNMTARWGSCMVSGKVVTLNFKLIYAPPELLDYVILHELCHFKSKYHDKVFYDYLTLLLPCWKERKKALGNKYIYYTH